jgi:hypothetical protein
MIPSSADQRDGGPKRLRGERLKNSLTLRANIEMLPECIDATTSGLRIRGLVVTRLAHAQVNYEC